MHNLDSIRNLIRCGRFREALETLSNARLHGLSDEVLRAELLERVGRHATSKTLIERLSKAKLTLSESSTCEFVLAQIAWETSGDTEKALCHMQKSSTSAEQAKDLHQLCLCQLRLVVMLADKCGPNVVLPIVAQ